MLLSFWIEFIFENRNHTSFFGKNYKFQGCWVIVFFIDLTQQILKFLSCARLPIENLKIRKNYLVQYREQNFISRMLPLFSLLSHTVSRWLCVGIKREKRIWIIHLKIMTRYIGNLALWIFEKVHSLLDKLRHK